MGGRCSQVALLALDKPGCEDKWPDDWPPRWHWCSSMSSGHAGCHPYFWRISRQHYRWKKNSAALIPLKYSLHVVPKWRAWGWLIQLRLLSLQQTTNDEILTDDSLPSASNRLVYKCTHTSHASCSKRCLPWSVCNLPMYELGKTGRAFIWRRQRVSDTYTINREIVVVKNLRSCIRLQKLITLNRFHSEFFCNK